MPVYYVYDLWKALNLSLGQCFAVLPDYWDSHLLCLISHPPLYLIMMPCTKKAHLLANTPAVDLNTVIARCFISCVSPSLFALFST